MTRTRARRRVATETLYLRMRFGGRWNNPVTLALCYASPLQLHVVHWNADKYPSFVEAAHEPDGLAVVGVFLQVRGHCVHGTTNRVSGVASTFH